MPVLQAVPRHAASR